MADKRTVLVCSCEKTMPLDTDAIGRGCRVTRARTGGDREIFHPERALLGARLAQECGGGQESGSAGGEKLAAIHCVTPASEWEGFDADINQMTA